MKIVMLALLCAGLTGCLTPYKPVDGPSAELRLHFPAHRTSVLVDAKLRIAVHRVDESCNSEDMGWLQFDPKTAMNAYRLPAGQPLWFYVGYTPAGASNAHGNTTFAFMPDADRRYSLEFLTDDKTFEVNLYDETAGTRSTVPLKDHYFDFCRGVQSNARAH